MRCRTQAILEFSGTGYPRLQCLTLAVGLVDEPLIAGLALEGSSVPLLLLRIYHWEKLIITCYNDFSYQSVVQIFSACLENESMEYFLCSVTWFLIWEKTGPFACSVVFWSALSLW